MDILILSSMLGHVRHQKRIAALIDQGCKVHVFGFERRWYPSKELSYAHTLLGCLTSGRYVRRILAILTAIPRVSPAVRKVQVVYAFGMDMAIFARLVMLVSAQRRPLVYEVGDIRPILTGSGMRSRLCRTIDAFLVRGVELLVATSPAFVTDYYGSVASAAPHSHIVVENKLDPRRLPPRVPASTSVTPDTLTIGYFGVLRCARSWEILTTVARLGEGRVRVRVRGFPVNIPTFQRDVRATPFLEYGGPYVVPDDLAEMYGGVDLVWACYPFQDHESSNWQWARTCRFYEACYFKRPMVVQAHTQDAAAVEHHDIGLSLDLRQVPRACSRILSLSGQDCERWSRNLEDLPTAIYLYEDEHVRLTAVMADLVSTAFCHSR